MARITYVKKSRKENKCSDCGKVIPVGSAYQWISFNYGGTTVRCNTCGFKPYETTANEYVREVGRINYDFANDIGSASTIEDLEELKSALVTELEGIRDEQEEKRENLPEQFQDAGPGEIITERYDNLEGVIGSLEDIDFDLEEELTEDLDEMLDKVLDLDSLEEEEALKMEDDAIRDRYKEWADEQDSEKVTELQEAITEAMSNLEEV